MFPVFPWSIEPVHNEDRFRYSRPYISMRRAHRNSDVSTMGVVSSRLQRARKRERRLAVVRSDAIAQTFLFPSKPVDGPARCVRADGVTIPNSKLRASLDHAGGLSPVFKREPTNCANASNSLLLIKIVRIGIRGPRFLCAKSASMPAFDARY